MGALEVFHEDIGSLLLVHEYDHRWFVATRIEDLYQSCPVPTSYQYGIVRRSGWGTYFFLSSPETNSTRCSTVSTACPATPIVTIAGRRRYFFASRSTAGGIVAENMTWGIQPISSAYTSNEAEYSQSDGTEPSSSSHCRLPQQLGGRRSSSPHPPPRPYQA